VSTRANFAASPKPNNILQNVHDKIPARHRNPNARRACSANRA